MLGQQSLRTQVEALGARHLVIGHYAGQITFADQSVRQPKLIGTEFNGLVYFIDTGLSRSAGGRGRLLHRRAGQSQVESLNADGQPTILVPQPSHYGR